MQELELQSVGVKHRVSSPANLVDNINRKQRKGKQKTQRDNDIEYVPNCNDADEEFDSSSDESQKPQQEHADETSKKGEYTLLNLFVIYKSSE